MTNWKNIFATYITDMGQISHISLKEKTNLNYIEIISYLTNGQNPKNFDRRLKRNRGGGSGMK